MNGFNFSEAELGRQLGIPRSTMHKLRTELLTEGIHWGRRSARENRAVALTDEGMTLLVVALENGVKTRAAMEAADISAAKKTALLGGIVEELKACLLPVLWETPEVMWFPVRKFTANPRIVMAQAGEESWLAGKYGYKPAQRLRVRIKPEILPKLRRTMLIPCIHVQKDLWQFHGRFQRNGKVVSK